MASVNLAASLSSRQREMKRTEVADVLKTCKKGTLGTVI